MLIRKVVNTDCHLLFNWANDWDVRNNAISKDPILLEDHIKWFEKRINSEQTFIFILENAGIPIGQVRYEYIEEAWIIDYSIDVKYRMKGYGKFLIKNTLDLIEQYPIIAYVKNDNIGSKKVFEVLNFQLVESKLINYDNYLIYKYERDQVK